MQRRALCIGVRKQNLNKARGAVGIDLDGEDVLFLEANLK
jgi:hypothetical protein